MAPNAWALPDVEMCGQERDTSLWGEDASQGEHALVIELGVSGWSHVLVEEPWLGRGGGAQGILTGSSVALSGLEPN